MTMSKGQKSQDNSDIEEQALKEAEIIAKLAPSEKVRKEAKNVAEKLGESVEQNSSASNMHDRQLEETDKVSDESKRTIKKITNEVNGGIQQYAKALGELQEQTIQATKQIGCDCIELQSETNLLIPYLEKMYFSCFTPWITSKITSEYFNKMVNNFVDHTVAVTNLTNNIALVNIESIQQLTDNVRKYYNIGVCSVKTIKENLATST